MKILSRIFAVFLLYSISLYTYGAVLPVSKNPKNTVKEPVNTLKISAWLPYWKVDDAVNEVLLHIDKLDEISPFAFTIKTDGTLKNNFVSSSTDQADDSITWKLLLDTAHQNKKISYTIYSLDR